MSKHKRHPPGVKIQRGIGGCTFTHGQEPFHVQAEHVEYGHTLCWGVQDFKHHAPTCSGRRLSSDENLPPEEGARFLMDRGPEDGVFEPRSRECYAAFIEWKNG